jgi:hypothetical protein
MAKPEEQNAQGEDQEQRTAAPPDWPGIPGRSHEHESDPNDKGPSEVNDAQRKLEEEVQKTRT